MADVDDLTIGPDCGLFRRVHPDWIRRDEETGQVEVRSMAFRDPRMSVDVEDLLIAKGRDHTFSLRKWPSCSLVRLRAGFVRGLGQIIATNLDPDQPDNDAHAEVIGRKSRKISQAIRDSAQWVVGPHDSN